MNTGDVVTHSTALQRPQIRLLPHRSAAVYHSVPPTPDEIVDPVEAENADEAKKSWAPFDSDEREGEPDGSEVSNL